MSASPWKQSTGQTATQSVKRQRLQLSVTTKVIAALLSSALRANQLLRPVEMARGARIVIRTERCPPRLLAQSPGADPRDPPRWSAWFRPRQRPKPGKGRGTPPRSHEDPGWVIRHGG